MASKRKEILTYTILVAAVGATYSLTFTTTVNWGNSAHLCGAAYSLGIPKGPGHPLYTWLGKLFTFLPFGPIVSTNLLTAFLSAASLFVFAGIGRILGWSLLTQLSATLMLALSLSYWQHTTMTTARIPGIFFQLCALLVLILGFLWEKYRFFSLATLIIGIGSAVHWSALLWLPMTAFVTIFGKKRIRSEARRKQPIWKYGGYRILLIASTTVGLLIGLCLFLYIPWRAQQAPPINYYTAHASTYWLHFFPKNNPSVLLGFDHYNSGNLFQFLDILFKNLTPIGVPLILLGMYWWLRTNAFWFISLLLAAATNVIFFLASLPEDTTLLPCMTILFLLIGGGLETLQNAARHLLTKQLQHAYRIKQLIAFVILILPVFFFVSNFHFAREANSDEPKIFANKIIHAAPKNAQIFWFYKNSEFKKNAVFANYYQTVLGKRPDITSIRLNIANTEPIDQALASNKAVFLYEDELSLHHSYKVKKLAWGLHRVSSVPKENNKKKAILKKAN